MRKSLCLFVCLVFVACGGAESGGTTAPNGAGPPAAPTPSTTPTTVPPPTATLPPSTSTTTTQPPDDGELPMLLVSSDYGLDISAPSGMVSVVRGRPVSVAFADRGGGAIFAAADEAGRPVIEQVARPGEPPEVLIGYPDVLYAYPTQVTEIDGKLTLVYRQTTELPNDCPAGNEECRWGYLQEDLHLYALESGVDRMVGWIGGFESDHFDVRFGGKWATVVYEPYGGEYSCATLVEAAQLLGDWDLPRLRPGEDAGCVAGAWQRATLAPDGSAWVRLDVDPAAGVKLVVLDPESGTELLQVELPTATSPSMIDYDGGYAVLSDWARTAGVQEDLPVVIVGPDGTVYESAATGRATIWSGPPPAGLSKEWKVTLYGIGPIRAGMSVEEAEGLAGTDLVEEVPPLENQGKTCGFVVPLAGPDGVRFMVVDGIIERTDITLAGFETVSGARVGDTESAILDTYSGQIEVMGHEYDELGHYLVFVPRDPEDAGYRLLFETDGEVVTQFRSGSTSAVLASEGCS